ncbi:hypothetical protein Zm00014a_038359 [Zea mays]|uniref:Uncharacterized protein n=1 Tax=Zea mays TaxID=4577 RepID=A0A3L6EBC5_MAIZE|nr:hypothetical protein Zm00014a_038359 [Zea mays]
MPSHLPSNGLLTGPMTLPPAPCESPITRRRGSLALVHP